MTLKKQWDSDNKQNNGRAQFNKVIVDPDSANQQNVYIGGLQNRFLVVSKSDPGNITYTFDRADDKSKKGLSDVSAYRVKEYVIIGSGQGTLYKVTAGDANRDWSKKLGSAITGRPVANSSQVHTSTNDGRIVTYEYEMGNQQWSTDVGDGIYSPLRRDSNFVYATTKDGELVVLGTANGEEKWRESFAPFGNAGPALGDSKVYVASNEVYAYDASSSKNQVWKSDGFGGSIGSTPVYSDKTVYVGSEDGKIYALSTDPVSDQIKWTFDTGSPVAGGPAVNAAGTRIAVMSTDGKVYVLDDNGSKKQEISDNGKIAEDSRSTPTFQNGAPYFGDRNGIVWKYE